MKLENDKGSSFEYFPDGADRAYQVAELLDGVRRDESYELIPEISQAQGRGGPAITYTIYQYGGSIIMGDKFSKISNSTIVNRSLVESSFNEVKSEAGEEMAKVLLKVAEVVADSGNKERARFRPVQRGTSEAGAA